MAEAVTLAPKQTMQLTFAATVNHNLLANRSITNTAQLTASELITAVQASELITTIAPTLAISDVTVIEGDTRASQLATATFPVTLSPASALPVTVEYTTVNGSATGDDYTSTSGTLIIPAGEITGTISVPITDDELAEADETFTLQLSNATNATLIDGSATATISANDQPPTSVTLASLSAHPSAGGYVGAGWLLGALFGLLLVSPKGRRSALWGLMQRRRRA